MLLSLTVSLKHCGFREEKEWRLIHSPMLRPSPSTAESTVIVDGIPQTVHALNLANRPDEETATAAGLLNIAATAPGPRPRR